MAPSIDKVTGLLFSDYILPAADEGIIRIATEDYGKEASAFEDKLRTQAIAALQANRLEEAGSLTSRLIELQQRSKIAPPKLVEERREKLAAVLRGAVDYLKEELARRGFERIDIPIMGQPGEVNKEISILTPPEKEATEAAAEKTENEFEITGKLADKSLETTEFLDKLPGVAGLRLLVESAGWEKQPAYKDIYTSLLKPEFRDNLQSKKVARDKLKSSKTELTDAVAGIAGPQNMSVAEFFQHPRYKKVISRYPEWKEFINFATEKYGQINIQEFMDKIIHRFDKTKVEVVTGISNETITTPGSPVETGEVKLQADVPSIAPANEVRTGLGVPVSEEPTAAVSPGEIPVPEEEAGPDEEKKTTQVIRRGGKVESFAIREVEYVEDVQNKTFLALIKKDSETGEFYYRLKKDVINLMLVKGSEATPEEREKAKGRLSTLPSMMREIMGKGIDIYKEQNGQEAIPTAGQIFEVIPTRGRGPAWEDFVREINTFYGDYSQEEILKVLSRFNEGWEITGWGNVEESVFDEQLLREEVFQAIETDILGGKDPLTAAVEYNMWSDADQVMDRRKGGSTLRRSLKKAQSLKNREISPSERESVLGIVGVIIDTYSRKQFVPWGKFKPEYKGLRLLGAIIAAIKSDKDSEEKAERLKEILSIP